MSSLLGLSEEIAKIVEQLGPGIVRVDGGRRQSASGLVWAPGVVVTSNHALAYKEGNSVDFGDGELRPAVAVGHDPSTDLAVLRVAGAPAAAATAFDDGEKLKVGALALKLGRPGKTVRATLGVVSALGTEPWRLPGGTQVARYLESDAGHQPGFSGGALVSAEGKIVGLTTTGLLRGKSLAVPTPTVRKVVEQLLAHGRVRRGYLGVSSQPVRLPDALAQQLGGEIGLLVHAVEDGGPAARAGLVLGDTLVGLGGPAVATLEDLENFLADDHVGEAVHARIVRGGQVVDIQITIGERP